MIQYRLISFFLCVASVFAETLQQGEYFIDIDPGEGSATKISNISEANFSGTINVSANDLSAGVHLLGVRFQDAEGDWSQLGLRPFTISLGSPPSFARGEYFLNTDPGEGNGIEIPLAGNPTYFESSIQIPVSAIDPSFTVNLLGVRFLDAEGSWSQTVFRPFIVTLSEAPELTKGEYFFNSDPGEGLATSFENVTGTTFDREINLSEIALENLPTGVNLLGVRFQDEEGSWGQTIFRIFTNTGPIGSAIQTVIWKLHRGETIVNSGEIDGGGTTRLDFRRRAPLSPLNLGDRLLLEVQVVDNIGNQSQKVFRELTIGDFDQDFLTQNFSLEERNNPLVSGDFADPDNDGLVNILEQALGLNPRDSSEGTEGTQLNINEDGLGFQFLAPAETSSDAENDQFQLAGLVYRVMVSDDLISWRIATSPEDFQVIQGPLEREDGLVRHQVTPTANDGGKSFYQLEINRP